jgi:uncharacterized protein YacL
MKNGANNHNQKEQEPSPKEMGFVVRALLALGFFILGFNLSKTAFFNAYPMFGYHSIAEVFISIGAAFLGFYIVPFLLIKAKYWAENLVIRTVTDIVTNFWELQSKRIQEARREKQKRKSESDFAKMQEDLESGILLDTSVLIDGRIIDVAKAGFLSGTLIVLQEVINELHLVSDNADKLKRQRGRRGLDIVKDLKKYAKVVAMDSKVKEVGVDKILVKFAKQHKLKLMTLDFNLNKVANVGGIKVLNLNELINALKTVYLPGEEMKVKIIQEGKEKNQGVGYLQDGTMIIVQNAKDKVGQEVATKVAKIIQSPAGKMIFCELL